ncbi:substrate-binding periplasmic protein [Fusibacter ferrireducens]|uniref:Transporter substrate-binding domain-containing protein n=1 Tax=Fusibacter ferrireducens TaxID=2785058 RepID=A0ABR9ZU93_9FIRM|nr:transporter substrate-binding domain-containing protein [Fusibacter ferrireducens]MBF4693450.1 transporter substrate-binding domain-containing protein [Fusibacter ferrireducens]
MKKILAVIMVMMLAIGLAGCAPKEKEANAAAPAPESTNEAAAPAPEAAPEKLVIKVGTDDAYPPFEYHEEATNELIGFDVDFAKALAEEMGVEIEYVPTAWDGIFNGVNTGQYDMIISCVSITPDRIEGFGMTNPYLSNGIVIVSAADGEQATSIDQLDGKKVGVQLETTADIAAKKFIADGTDISLSQFDSVMEAFAALKGGSIEYILVDSSVGGFYISTDPESFNITSGLLSNEPIGICMAKENTELLEKVNAGIKALQDSGKMTEISQKWFSADFATNIDAEIKVIE